MAQPQTPPFVPSLPSTTARISTRQSKSVSTLSDHKLINFQINYEKTRLQDEFSRLENAENAKSRCLEILQFMKEHNEEDYLVNPSKNSLTQFHSIDENDTSYIGTLNRNDNNSDFQHGVDKTVCNFEYFVEDTRIYTSKSDFKKINEIQKGDSVLSLRIEHRNHSMKDNKSVSSIPPSPADRKMSAPQQKQSNTTTMTKQPLQSSINHFTVDGSNNDADDISYDSHNRSNSGNDNIEISNIKPRVRANTTTRVSFKKSLPFRNTNDAKFEEKHQSQFTSYQSSDDDNDKKIHDSIKRPSSQRHNNQRKHPSRRGNSGPISPSQLPIKCIIIPPSTTSIIETSPLTSHSNDDENNDIDVLRSHSFSAHNSRSITNQMNATYSLSQVDENDPLSTNDNDDDDALYALTHSTSDFRSSMQSQYGHNKNANTNKNKNKLGKRHSEAFAKKNLSKKSYINKHVDNESDNDNKNLEPVNHHPLKNTTNHNNNNDVSFVRQIVTVENINELRLTRLIEIVYDNDNKIFCTPSQLFWIVYKGWGYPDPSCTYDNNNRRTSENKGLFSQYTQSGNANSNRNSFTKSIHQNDDSSKASAFGISAQLLTVSGKKVRVTNIQYHDSPNGILAYCLTVNKNGTCIANDLLVKVNMNNKKTM